MKKLLESLHTKFFIQYLACVAVLAELRVIVHCNSMIIYNNKQFKDLSFTFINFIDKNIHPLSPFHDPLT